MSGFPPAKNKSLNNPAPKPDIKPSTGDKDLQASIKMKDAGIKVTPGVEKNVNAF